MYLDHSLFNQLQCSSPTSFDTSEVYDSKMRIRDSIPGPIIVGPRPDEWSKRQLDLHLDEEADAPVLRDYDTDRYAFDCNRCGAPEAIVRADYGGVKVERLASYCNDCMQSKHNLEFSVYSPTCPDRIAEAGRLGIALNCPRNHSGPMTDHQSLDTGPYKPLPTKEK